MNELKQFLNSLNKLYFCNFVAVFAVILAIAGAFFVQFKVESLQDSIAQAENEIAEYKDQIKLLEVEWTYLTRPERLRTLAARYLKDNGYTLASQIKDNSAMDKYFTYATQNSKEAQMAMNDDMKKISF